MLTTVAQAQTKQNILTKYDGEFDAAIALPPRQTHGEYWQGYLGYTAKTGNAPF
ncbi:hypothetical protein [Nostoc sp. FACHB-190]|uniref:hypothetical protein n=1 Tax=Nostoc sp. FACHB-190 TaxID=2692838 RepID=UPI0016842E84|nr:hypothetical protein [Nostoc sp. FACHB-190]MBD2303603.1 hypothetical protein [Nostoc sp. FACHB-190]